MLTRSQFLTSLAAGLCAGCSARAAPQVSGQPRPRLYACDGCEAMVRQRDLSTVKSWRTVIAGRQEAGERMILRGRIFQPDGEMPARDVILFAYHTDAQGIYAPKGQRPRLVGWVRTDSGGRYAFDTIKPAPYPNRTMPAHVHLYVLEPGRPVYFIDDVVFDGEFLVDDAYRRNQQLRGGSGIVKLERRPTELNATRDIVLERHPA